jgi:DNA processing protein
MSKEFEHQKYWLGFSKVYGLGFVKIEKLLNYFENLESAWQGSLNDFIQAGIEPKFAQKIVATRKETNLNKEMEFLYQEKIEMVHVYDEDYPELLSEIYSPPPVLFYRGQLKNVADKFSLGVVGTRKLSEYGKQITPRLVTELVQNKMVIVSGMALGIDALAHESCLSAGGRTIAVLGSGIDNANIYPSFNRYLFEKIIASNGLVVSEYPPGTRATKFTFPARNRIISGLSLGSLVIEAPASSGALLTTGFALEQNREVFAVPGSVLNKNSIGPNNLIKQGAKAVTSGIDIIEALDLSLVKSYVETQKAVADTPEEQLVLDNLTHEAIHINELSRLTKIDIRVLNSTLTLMEMKGKIKNLGNMMFVLL